MKKQNAKYYVLCNKLSVFRLEKNIVIDIDNFQKEYIADVIYKYINNEV